MADRKDTSKMKKKIVQPNNASRRTFSFHKKGFKRNTKRRNSPTKKLSLPITESSEPSGSDDFTLLFKDMRGQNGWEDSLRQRPAKVMKIQPDEIPVKQMPKKADDAKTNGIFKKPPAATNKLKKLLVLNENENSSKPSDRKWKVGEIVWARLRQTKWWPAMVINGSDCMQAPAQPGHMWVYWFGDHRISKLAQKKLTPFDGNFGVKYKSSSGKLFTIGVSEALRIVGDRAGMNSRKLGNQGLVSWAEKGFQTCDLNKQSSKMGIPDSIRKHLKEIKTNHSLSNKSRSNSAEVKGSQKQFHQTSGSTPKLSNHSKISKFSAFSRSESCNGPSSSSVFPPEPSHDIKKTESSSKVISLPTSRSRKKSSSVESASKFHAVPSQPSDHTYISFQKKARSSGLPEPTNDITALAGWNRSFFSSHSDYFGSSNSVSKIPKCVEKALSHTGSDENCIDGVEDKSFQATVCEEVVQPDVQMEFPDNSVYVTQPKESDSSDILLADGRENKDKSKDIVMKEPPAKEIFLPGKEVGQIVWGKMNSFRPWPAMIIGCKDCGKPVAPVGHVWVFFFGDHKVAKVCQNKLQSYTKEFNANYHERAGKFFSKSIQESLVIVANRAGLLFDENNLKGMINWSKDGFQSKHEDAISCAPNPELGIPPTVRSYLEAMKASFTVSDSEDDSDDDDEEDNDEDDDDDDDLPKLKQSQTTDSAAKRVKSGEKKIEDVCIACDSCCKEIVMQHPLFRGGLCGTCRSDVQKTMFAYGNDGKNIFCVICGQVGRILVCDNDDCNRSVCFVCVELWAASDAKRKIEAMSPWFCFFCANYDTELNGFLRKNEDWEQQVIHLLQTDHFPPWSSAAWSRNKRPLRVLSLFNCIGTAYHVLKSLKIEVEIYFASEVDQDCVMISQVRSRGKVKHLGNIKDITDAQLSEIAPIDLVIGCSSCTDLRPVVKKGSSDEKLATTKLFHFKRMLKSLQNHSGGNHVFWLFECVATTPLKCRRLISSTLECEQVKLDCKFFTALHRASCFWGNIPGMHAVKKYWQAEKAENPVQTHYLGKSILLDDYLTDIPYFDRRALVPKIKTEPSAKQAKEYPKPVGMNGEVDNVWVTELEQIFGLPAHYTDVGNMQLERRRQFLGKSLSTPVVKYLLTPLKNFFEAVQPASSQNGHECNSL